MFAQRSELNCKHLPMPPNQPEAQSGHCIEFSATSPSSACADSKSNRRVLTARTFVHICMCLLSFAWTFSRKGQHMPTKLGHVTRKVGAPDLGTRQWQYLILIPVKIWGMGLGWAFCSGPGLGVYKMYGSGSPEGVQNVLVQGALYKMMVHRDESQTQNP